MLIVIVQSVITLSVIILNVIIVNIFFKYHYFECHYVDITMPNCILNVNKQSGIILSVFKLRSSILDSLL